MKDFLVYFLGEGKEVEFTNFGFSHFAPILVAVAIIFLIFKFRDKISASKHEKIFRYALAFTMIICDMSYYWRLVALPSLGPNPATHLPITVCGWAIIFGSFMLIGKSQTLFDIVYFWVFAGTIFAVATPTVISYTGPTRFRYYQFWVEHLAGYIAIFYMIFVHKFRPKIFSLIKSYISFAILAIVAFITNNYIVEGANYLFMAKPESTPSILDILPPNFFLRILIMASAVTLLFFLAYLPWYLMDRKSKQLKNIKMH